MCTKESLDHLLDNASEDEVRRISGVVNVILNMQNKIIQIFHISMDQLNAIERGELEVERVVFKHERKCFRRIKRYAITVASVVLLIACLAIPGFADNLRISFLSVFTRPTSTQVNTISYNKYSADLSEIVLPEYILEGYQYAWHTNPSGTNLVNVVYANANGNEMQYFYYPAGGNASYDNEYTKVYTLQLNSGMAHVGRSDDHGTTIYFMYQNAFVQINFDTQVDDAQLKAIANSLHQMDH